MGSLAERVLAFQKHDYEIQKKLYKQLCSGQHPEILFITCSDSRIQLNELTQSKPGEVFAIRNAGNIIPSYPHAGGESASLEFALTTLPIKHIVICGHSQCGAMKGVIDPVSTEQMPAVRQWLKHGPDLMDITKKCEGNADKSLLDVAIAENVLLQMEHLKQHPCVKSKLEAMQITLYSWIFEFETGKVLTYDIHTSRFESLFPDNAVELQRSRNVVELSGDFIIKHLGAFTVSAECALLLLGLWRANPCCVVAGLSMLAGSYLGSKIGFFGTVAAQSNEFQELVPTLK